MITVALDELFSPINSLVHGKSLSDEKKGWLASIEVINRSKNIHIATKWNDLLLQQLTIYCPNIQQLDLSYTSITSLSPLSNLKQLTNLLISYSVLNYCNENNLPFLPYVIDSSPISDLSPLASLTQLTHLSLDGTSVSDLTPLSGLTQLTHLSLDYTRIEDLTPLAALSQLTNLSLDFTKVTNLSPLTHLTQLITLSVNNNSISDLTPLRSLPHLSSLFINCTEVNDLDLSPLADLTQLEKLVLSFSPNNVLPQDSDPEDSHPTVIDLSFLNKLSKLTHLSLWDLQSMNDLSILDNLSNLSVLRLFRTSITDLTPLTKFTGIKKLNIYLTPIEDITPLAKLTHLTELALNSTDITDLSPISKLKELSILSIFSTRVEDLSPLADLKQLSILNICNTSVHSLSPIKKLTKLTRLFFDRTSIDDLSPLSNLSQLQHISLDSTLVKDLSPLSRNTLLNDLSFENTSIDDLSPLADLIEIANLSFDNTDVKNIAPLSKLTQIKTLSMNETPITNLSPLTNFSQLTYLSINDTSVSDLSPLASLSQLIVLSIDNTKVKDLSPISELPLFGISLRGLHLIEIPRNLVEKTKEIEIENTSIIKQPSALFKLPKEQIIQLYYDQVKVPVREGKVIFLGNSGVGKTHTIRRIIQDGEEIPIFLESTQGVQIYSYPDKANQTIIKFWDFGGQDIQQSMHKCFLTERTCYVVVVSNRDPEKSMPEAVKWLRTISTFSEQVSVLLLVNQWSEVPPQHRIDETTLHNLFPRLSKKIIYYYAKDDSQKDFQTVIQAIVDEVNNLDSVQLELPESWAAIRNELLDSRENYISLEKYQKLCTLYGLGGNDEAMVSIRQWLLHWFNDLGICFSYHDNSNDDVTDLANYKVLKPGWLTNGIYRLILWGYTFSKGGIIDRESIETVLQKEKYRVNRVNTDYNSYEAGYILEVMRKLGRSYQESEETEFIPDLLEAKIPTDVEPKGYNTIVSYSCTFAWLPRILLHRLMISLREWSDGTRWLTGFRLYENNTYILITGDTDKNLISMKLFTNEIPEYFYPFHQARLLLLKYAEEMSIKIAEEKLSCNYDHFCAEDDLYSLIWDYANDYEAKKTSTAIRGSRPEKTFIKNLLLPFFNKTICVTANELNDNGINFVHALNAIVAVYPYCTPETIKAVNSSSNWNNLMSKQKIDKKGNHPLSPYARLAHLSIEHRLFLNWLEEYGTKKSDRKKGIVCPADLHGINAQLYSWASDSPLYKKAVGNPDMDTLAQALDPTERIRYKASIQLMETVWTHHPELGLMPDYVTLSKQEHDGAYYPGYRDHVTHMFKVYLLGMYLYEKDDTIHNIANEEDFFNVWTLCALWHDVGYLIETKESARDGKDAKLAFTIFNAKLALPLTNLFPNNSSFKDNEAVWQRDYNIYASNIDSLVACEEMLNEFRNVGETVRLTHISGSNPIKTYYETVFCPRIDRFYYDHGIISSTFLLFTKESLCKYMEGSKQFPMYDDEAKERDGFLNQMEKYKNYVKKASEAIALHNIINPSSDSCRADLIRKHVTISNFRIDIQKEPFPWLLRVCDEIQCWDRQRFNNPPEDNKISIEGDDLQFDTVFLQLQFKNDTDKKTIINALSPYITPLPSFLS